VRPDNEGRDDDVTIEEASTVDELSGKMARNPDAERLMHTVMENDEQDIKDGKLIAESTDYAMGSFTPDLIFEKLVQNYKNAERMLGPTIIRELTGYEGGFVERNVKVSEFREEIKKNIHHNVDRMKKDGLLDKDGRVTEQGLSLAKLIRYTEELDHLIARGLGKKEITERSHYGEPDGTVPFRQHRYKDVDVRGSVTRAIRRGHTTIEKEDLRAIERREHGKVSIVYAMDASGSMRGSKLRMGKRAGIALAYQAIQDRNDVGLVIFTSRIEKSIPPTREFGLVLEELSKVRAGQETDIGLVIDHCIPLFPKSDMTKHLVLLTDALPTRGEDPGRIAQDAAARAAAHGITISVVGLALEKEGATLAGRIVELGHGKLYRVTNLEELDTIILEDYAALAKQ
jgi:Mg-chelatase subunit ChlD